MSLRTVSTILLVTALSTLHVAAQVPSPSCARHQFEQYVLFNHDATCSHRPTCALDCIQAFVEALPLDSQAVPAVSSVLQIQSEALGLCGGANPSLSKSDRAIVACDIGRAVLKEEKGGWVGPTSSSYIDQAENNWYASSPSVLNNFI